jgi:hypothetical protein
MTLFGLYVLALLDGLLCGIRSSMGRCALIQKRSYYGRALLRGLAGAQMISSLALLALLLTAGISHHRRELRADLEIAAAHMLWVFLPYAAVVLLSLALRILPSTDIRSATSVFALGPFTAIRPLVMIVGVLYGISYSHLFETRLLGLFILGLMLSLEFALNLVASRRQSFEIRQLV